MAVLGETRVIGNFAVQAKLAEQAIGKVKVDFLA